MTDDDRQHDLGEQARRELTALESILRKTRRRLRTPLLVEGIAWTVATLGAVLATAQIVALALGDDGVTPMRWMLVVGGGATLLGALLALTHWVRARPSLDQVARRLQRAVPEFRSDIVAALEFGRALCGGDGDDGSSPQLAFAHLKQTTRDLLGRASGDGTLATLLEPRPLAPALAAVAGCLVLLLAPMLFAGEQLRELWRQALWVTQSEADAATHRPVVGDITLAFSFPPYTKLQPHVEPFTTGQISTLVGTEVTIRTYALIRAEKFEVVITTTDGVRVVPMKELDGRLEATLLLTRPGTYSFRATLEDGEVVVDGAEREVRLTEDAAPTVTITSHSGEIEVSPDEVLQVTYTVSDDYGIESVTRAAAFGREDPKLRAFDLPELTTSPRELQNSFDLDLREFALQPRDTLTVWVEATDNNSLTGPGVGKAAPLMLRVSSPEDRHQRLIARQTEVLEALLLVLADLLENPVGERSPDRRGYYEQKVDPAISPADAAERYRAIVEIQATQATVLAAMGALVEELKSDPLMATRNVTLFEALYKQLYEIDRDGAEMLNTLASSARAETLLARELQRLATWAARDEDALEKGLIRLDNMLASQKMDAARRAADEIRDLKDRIKELLENYRNTNDPALKEAIMREIQRLRQRMAELMQQMTSQIERLPREHVNMEAIEQAKLESDAAKMTDSMQKMEDLLEQGDIDGALRALEEMTQSLDQMSSEMNQQFDDAEPDGLREMDKALSELMDSANDLEGRQRELEERTRDAHDEQARSEHEQLRQALQRRLDEVKRLAEQQREQLDQARQRDLARHDLQNAERALERVRRLEQLLAELDIDQALQQARASREDLRSMQFSVDLAKQYQPPGSSRGDAVEELLRDLNAARPRALRIETILQEMIDQARSQRQRNEHPQLKELEREQREVEQQAQRLQHDVGRAAERFPMLQQQLGPPLGKARGQMGDAAKSLQEGKSQQSLDQQRGALDSLRELKQEMRNALQKQRQGQQGQQRQQNRDKVVIPTEDGRSQQHFRQDVMDGMKRDRLQDYDSEIQRYYESLMQ